MLSVKNLVKEFNGLTAVNNISFQVDEGKIFGLLGPNGAGKTTTIRTILNIIKPTQGEILFDNKKISNDFFNIIGYLPEERGLYKKSKVIDVIRYFGELKNMSADSVQKEAKQWLEKLEMTDYVNKKVEELSKGNQQKIQFITSVIHNPKLLILDEPFSGLDPINQQMIKEKILDFVTSGKIIILCTHQMETAEKLCSEIFLMNSGKEVLSGSISKIKKQFGGNNVKLEYDGDASFISNLPFVIHADIYNNYAEVQLKDSFKPSEFLKAVVEKVSVSQFSVIEPTLNKIFIDSISKSAGN
ncbi:MAG: ATP-binding cassette domain-containing protein [Ignavibacteriaceae bacterium]|nr:ATP-binding cassette domain-containing protein [Ignavibacteriaceae bacterium]